MLSLINKKNYSMKKFIKNYVEKFGYKPTIFELFNVYNQGVLILTDEEENSLLLLFKNNNLI
jgi:hypothetical protein